MCSQEVIASQALQITCLSRFPAPLPREAAGEGLSPLHCSPFVCERRLAVHGLADETRS